MTHFVALRAGASELGEARSLLEKFIQHFAAGQFPAAAELCAEPLWWFGSSFSRVSWTAAINAAQRIAVPMTAGSLRQVPTNALLGAEVALDGPVDPNDWVFLVEIGRLGREVTLGALVRRNSNRHLEVARIFDAESFACWVREV